MHSFIHFAEIDCEHSWAVIQVDRIVYGLKELKERVLFECYSIWEVSVTPHGEERRVRRWDQAEGSKQNAQLFQEMTVNESSKSPRWELVMWSCRGTCHLEQPQTEWNRSNYHHGEASRWGWPLGSQDKLLRTNTVLRSHLGQGLMWLISAENRGILWSYLLMGTFRVMDLLLDGAWRVYSLLGRCLLCGLGTLSRASFIIISW